MKRLFVSALAGVLLMATSAAAQSSAADLMRSGLAERGITSGFTVDSYSSPAHDPVSGKWDGLVVSEALVQGGGRWTFLSVVQNFTDRPYCIRPRIAFDKPWTITGQLTVNNIVQPGGHVVLMAASGPTEGGSINWLTQIAFWQPDLSAEFNRQCRSVAPAGLDDWLAATDRRVFMGSRR